MKSNQRIYFLALCAVLVLAVILRFLFTSNSSARPAPSASGYYTGPMRSKSGDTFATEEGKVVAPPAGPAASPATKDSSLVQKGSAE